MAIYLALVVAQWLCPISLPNNLVILGVGLLVAGVGLADDLRPLAWQVRLGVQTAAAIIAIVWLKGSDSSTAPALWLPWPLAVFWIVGLTNAFNMLDNMDALSAGVAWIAAGMFGIALAVRPRTPAAELVPYLMFMGALAGFLWFNFPPARIFMGDVGSTFLGFFLGVRSLADGFAEPALPSTWVLPVAVLAVPWYDLTTVVCIRLWQGRSPFHADKQHLSHRLVQLGLSSPVAVGVIYLLAASAAVGGLLVAHRWDAGALITCGLIAGILAVLVVIESTVHWLSSSLEQRG
jgi:UDP-GlcNAc:undecaprenyl-phosphate GlcNAc-1-phosphate transferase